MKKLLPIALMLSLLVSLFSLTAFAAEPEDVQLLYIQAPEEWEEPCVWAWDDDGTGAFDAWPGGNAEPDPDNPGWWYIYLPVWANNIIINANNGEVQTEDMQLEGVAWVTVDTEGAFEMSYEPLTRGEPPAYVEKFTLYAQIPADWDAPHLWAWLHPDGTNAFAAWPGEALEEAGDGWYSISAPTWINSIIINANEGEVQTEDIEVEPNTLWLTIDSDGSYELTYEDPTAPVATDTVMIRVMAPEDWTAPNLWAWTHPDGINVYAAWPGEPMAEGDDGWLYAEVPNWVNSVIVNANDGEVQTEDVRIEEGKDVWIVVSDADTVGFFYEEPEALPTAPQEPDAAESQPASTPEVLPAQSNSSNMVLYSIIAVAVVVIAAIVIVVLVRKKKK